MAIPLCKILQWTNEQIQWYLLSQDTEKLAHRPGDELIPAGRIFVVDYEESEIGPEGGEIVMKGCITGKHKVRWKHDLFYGLDVETKDLLVAIIDPSQRLRCFTAKQELLHYASQLKIGSFISVEYKSYKQLRGTVRYIGPLGEKPPGTHFGIELLIACGDSNGYKNGRVRFKCGSKKGIFVSFNNILLPSSNKQRQSPRKISKPAYCQGEDNERFSYETVDVPKTFLKVGDQVCIQGNAEKDFGNVACGCLLLVHDDMVAIEVNDQVNRPWDGYYKHKQVMKNPTKQTVFVKLSDVIPLTESDDRRQDCASGTNVPTRSQYIDKPSYAAAAAAASEKLASCDSKEERLCKSTKKHQEYCLKQMVENTGTIKIMSSENVQTSEPLSSGRYSPSQDRTSSASSAKKSSIESNFHHFRSLDSCKSMESMGSNENKSKSALRSLLPSWSKVNRGSALPYPFTDYHIQLMVKDVELVARLADELDLKEKWREICRTEPKHFFQVELLLNYWWESLYEGHKSQLQRFSDLLCNYQKIDLKDHINKTPDNGMLHETVILAFSEAAHDKWNRVAVKLNITQDDVATHIPLHLDGMEKLQLVLKLWQHKQPGYTNKLFEFTKVCREIGLSTLASQIEQGLVEETMTKISRRIDKGHFVIFCQKLSISDVRYDAFEKKFTYLSQRMYEVLCYWSISQPLTGVKKINVLSDALAACQLEEFAYNEFHKGLTDGDLQAVSLVVSEKWPKLLQEFEFSKHYEDWIKCEGPSEDWRRALRALELWKWHHLSTSQDLLEDLYLSLMNCGLTKSAKLLYYGLDPLMVQHLSRKLCSDWPVLAKHFQKGAEYISSGLRHGNQVEMAFVFLKEFINHNEKHGKEKTKALLVDGLKAIGRNEVIHWMENSAEEDDDENNQKMAGKAKDLSYPFSDYRVEVIAHDKKLCKGLITGLQLEEKWKSISEKETEDFFKVKHLLQHWWTIIRDDCQTQLQEFKILLAQYGREDLRDHMDKVPDRGMFDETILNTVIFSARTDWRKFASELQLGMKQGDIDKKLKQDVLPEESLRIVFHIWYKKERGCSKLGKLVQACRTNGQHALADEIEQGLSEEVLCKIASQIDLKSWQRLGEQLLVSQVRLDAFREKFKVLSVRVYHILCYWSMVQPYDADKREMLTNALHESRLGDIAKTELNKEHMGTSQKFGDTLTGRPSSASQQREMTQEHIRDKTMDRYDPVSEHRRMSHEDRDVTTRRHGYQDHMEEQMLPKTGAYGGSRNFRQQYDNGTYSEFGSVNTSGIEGRSDQKDKRRQYSEKKFEELKDWQNSDNRRGYYTDPRSGHHSYSLIPPTGPKPAARRFKTRDERQSESEAELYTSQGGAGECGNHSDRTNSNHSIYTNPNIIHTPNQSARDRHCDSKQNYYYTYVPSVSRSTNHNEAENEDYKSRVATSLTNPGDGVTDPRQKRSESDHNTTQVISHPRDGDRQTHPNRGAAASPSSPYNWLTPNHFLQNTNSPAPEEIRSQREGLTSLEYDKNNDSQDYGSDVRNELDGFVNVCRPGPF